MEGKKDLYFEIAKNNLEPEFILLSFKGLLKHLEQVESKIFFFSEILTYDDFSRITDALKFLKRILKFILTFAVINKRERFQGVKGTFV